VRPSGLPRQARREWAPRPAGGGGRRRLLEPQGAVPRFEGTRKFPGELAREPGARPARAARALRRGWIEPCKRRAGAAVCHPLGRTCAEQRS